MEQNYYSFLLDAPQDCSDLQNCCELNIHPQLSDSLGDLNGDGTVTPIDTMTEIQIIMNNTFYNMYNSYAGDMDYNDKVDIMDLLLISDNLNLTN